MGVTRAQAAAETEERLGFRDVLRVRSFSAMYTAETQSIIGDQLARVALSVLVFQRTHSAAQTALTYALTFLPAIVGGALLSGLADRYPRRMVMVTSDVIRCCLLAAMAIPGMSTGALFGLLVVAVFIGPAFTSAEVSLIADILDPARYRVATGLRMMTNQVAQAAGFAVGGAVLALISPHWVLAVDAATYGVSAILVLGFVRAPHKGAHRSPSREDEPVSLGRCLRILFGNAHLRALILLSWLAAFFVVPEGLAVPYAGQLGGGSAEAGYLLTAIPLGGVIGAYVVLRAIPARRRNTGMGLFAVLSGLPLLACALAPGVPLSMLAWLVSGVFAAYQLDVMTSIVQLTAPNQRGRVVGVLGACLIGIQGFGLIVFGVIAGHISVGSTIAVAGAVGSALALVGWVALARSARTAVTEQATAMDSTHLGIASDDGAASATNTIHNTKLTSVPRHSR